MKSIVSPVVTSLALAVGAIAQPPQLATLPAVPGISNVTSTPFGSQPIHYQLWYSAAELGLAIGQPARISQLAFLTSANGQAGRTIQMELRVANSVVTSPSGTFQNNMLSGETLVHPAQLGQPRNFTTPATVAGQYALVIPFQNEFIYDGSSGIVFDFRIFDNGNGGVPYPYDLTVEFLGGGRMVSLYNTSPDPIATFSDQFLQRGPRIRLTWRTGLSVPYGNGCEGHGNIMPVGGTAGGVPMGGNTAWQQTLTNAPAQRACVWFFGNSRTMWDTVPLPVTLDLLGAPNCAILATPTLRANRTTAGAGPGGGTVTISTPIPPIPFTGMQFFSQWIILDPLSPNGGIAATPGLWHLFS